MINRGWSRRLAGRLGELSNSDLQQVARAIKVQLALEP